MSQSRRLLQRRMITDAVIRRLQEVLHATARLITRGYDECTATSRPHAQHTITIHLTS